MGSNEASHKDRPGRTKEESHQQSEVLQYSDNFPKTTEATRRTLAQPRRPPPAATQIPPLDGRHAPDSLTWQGASSPAALG